MKPGPAPKPTALKKLQGNPGRRPLNDREPLPDTSKPRRPVWLSKKAKGIWDRTATPLHECGLLTSIDRDTFAAYCETVALMIELQDEYRKNGGAVIHTEAGLRVNPLIAQMRLTRDQLIKLAREFGMTPSARSGIKLPGALEEVEESLADVLFQAVNGD